LGDRAYLVLDLSFLAIAELARGEPRSALAAIDEALAGLASGQEGIEQVQAVHLNAHDIFAALGAADRARASLEQAVAIVTARLATLPDADSRRAFVERIRTNRAIAERAERAGIAFR
jgi:hypothetical protein